MALSAPVLKSLMQTKISAIPGFAGFAGDDILYLQAISEAIVQHIQTSAVVATVDTGTVTAGVAAGSPVSATGVGTVS